MNAMQKTFAVLACLLTTATAFASPVGGAVSAGGSLDAGARKVYILRLEGGESWHLTAHGYGDGDLDCYVYDENDVLMGLDNDNTQTCIVTGAAAWTGPFKVVLVNTGDEPIGYNVRVR